jgi:uncharacterized protein
MSDQSTQQPWPILSPLDRRLLGVLVEKQKTTPDVYPMTLNSLITGCNQKSNRDPVMHVTDHEITEALEGLQRQALATRVESGRVDKWRHLLYEQWGIGKAEIAVLAELLLRGPQTEGELRTRVSRMEPIADLDVLRAVCQPLAERKFVVYLTPIGRRGTTLTHGFHDSQELEHLRSGIVVSEPPSHAPSRSVESAPPNTARLDRLEAELATLRDSFAELKQAVADMKGHAKSPKSDGGSPDLPT